MTPEPIVEMRDVTVALPGTTSLDRAEVARDAGFQLGNPASRALSTSDASRGGDALGW